MKVRLITLIVFIIFSSLQLFPKNIVNKRNGVVMISTEQEKFAAKIEGFSWPSNGIMVLYGLDYYFDDAANSQYALRISFTGIINLVTIPTGGKLLIKTSKDEILELTAIISQDDFSDTFGNAYFPISETDLDKIINDRAVKIRLQLLADNGQRDTFTEQELKMSYASFSKKIGKMKESIIEDKEKGNFSKEENNNKTQSSGFYDNF